MSTRLFRFDCQCARFVIQHVSQMRSVGQLNASVLPTALRNYFTSNSHHDRNQIAIHAIASLLPLTFVSRVSRITRLTRVTSLLQLMKPPKHAYPRSAYRRFLRRCRCGMNRVLRGRIRLSVEHPSRAPGQERLLAVYSQSTTPTPCDGDSEMRPV